jgi:hypothetical protein
MGVFDVNMKLAQETAKPTATGATSTGLPEITGNIAVPEKIGLTHRDKVFLSILGVYGR